MLAVRTDHSNPLAEFRRLGIDARLAWHGDHDSDALVLVEPDPEDLRRLRMWTVRGTAARTRRLPASELSVARSSAFVLAAMGPRSAAAGCFSRNRPRCRLRRPRTATKFRWSEGLYSLRASSLPHDEL
jgi:hypothetical protein